MRERLGCCTATGSTGMNRMCTNLAAFPLFRACDRVFLRFGQTRKVLRHTKGLFLCRWTISWNRTNENKSLADWPCCCSRLQDVGWVPVALPVISSLAADLGKGLSQPKCILRSTCFADIITPESHLSCWHWCHDCRLRQR